MKIKLSLIILLLLSSSFCIGCKNKKIISRFYPNSDHVLSKVAGVGVTSYESFKKYCEDGIYGSTPNSAMTIRLEFPNVGTKFEMKIKTCDDVPKESVCLDVPQNLKERYSIKELCFVKYTD